MTRMINNSVEKLTILLIFHIVKTRKLAIVSQTALGASMSPAVEFTFQYSRTAKRTEM